MRPRIAVVGAGPSGFCAAGHLLHAGWEGWQRIDEHERSAGLPDGRPRVKLVRMQEMARIAAFDAMTAR